MKIMMIVAMDEQGIIGKDEKLPWNLSNDLKRFKKLTVADGFNACLLYTSPSPRDRTRSRMPSSA